ncbi:hypothetical protein OGZ37_05960 [Lactococcus lactis]|uniref:hypothetical protein n=1 Tax=Lactococcus lactis TaxID=1358 RepID=UPI00241851D3|nr:hypothetical protein [Lactococcus lactis]MDG4966120.1 hypothetical protein [Lactococcus lactis]
MNCSKRSVSRIFATDKDVGSKSTNRIIQLFVDVNRTIHGRISLIRKIKNCGGSDPPQKQVGQTDLFSVKSL